jgi:AcrR family transcriptional regulator
MEKEEIIIWEIIESAKKQFQQYGLHKTTMEDIAKSAGKGKSTLYYYFKSKDEIFDRVIEEEMNDFFSSVKAAVEKEERVSEKLRMYILLKVQKLKQKANLYRLTLETYNTVELNGHFRKLRDLYDDKEVHLINSILQKGLEENLFGTTIKEDLELLSEVLVASIRGIEMEIITRDKFNTLEDKVELLVKIIINGLK